MKHIRRTGPLRQTTLKSAINCQGVGLHSGRNIKIELRPADADSGIVFERTDLAPGDTRNPVIAARWQNVSDTQLATTVANEDGVSVGTVEHLMAALAGCRVDNVIVALNGPEVPVMDGSAEPFVFLIDCAGIRDLDVSRKAIKALRTITVGDGSKTLSIAPAETFGVSFEIDFESPAVAHQQIGLNIINGAFRSDIARARTFGFHHEVNQLRAAGLALGGSLDNAVVIDGSKVLNEGGLRFNDEFVRHKVLDCIGDLYLAGGPIIGQINAVRAGHTLNHALLKELFADKDNWAYVDMPAGFDQHDTDFAISPDSQGSLRASA